MLHRLHPSPENVGALTEGVRMQMALLGYAARVPPGGVPALDAASCAAFVDGVPGLAGRGAAAAAWVCNARSTTRRDTLARFATGAPVAQKTAWAETLRAEAEAFLAGVPAALTPLNAKKPWQVAAGEFLESFYHVFSSESGLPAGLLGRAAAFTRHDFLRAFAAENEHLYVCSMCDEGRIGTRRREDRLVSDIDHFFPKSVYPHLSIHPFNLVPICHACNSSTKGKVDPLEDHGARLAPGDVTLPYQHAVFSGNAFVGVDLDAWRAAASPFAIRARKVDGATDRQIERWARIAEIPERWNHIVDEIGETAFRRLSQYLRADPSIPDDPERLLAKLDEFLGTLQQENLGRDPLTYAIKWFLVHVAAAARRGDTLKEPLLDEIRAWIAAPGNDQARREIGEGLRKILDP